MKQDKQTKRQGEDILAAEVWEGFSEVSSERGWEQGMEQTRGRR